MALSGHLSRSPECPLERVKRTSATRLQMSVFDKADISLMRNTLALLPADARARRADVRHDHPGEAGGVEARGDHVRLQLSLLWNPIGAHGLPERIALPFTRKADLLCFE